MTLRRLVLTFKPNNLANESEIQAAIEVAIRDWQESGAA